MHVCIIKKKKKKKERKTEKDGRGGWTQPHLPPAVAFPRLRLSLRCGCPSRLSHVLLKRRAPPARLEDAPAGRKQAGGRTEDRGERGRDGEGRGAFFACCGHTEIRAKRMRCAGGAEGKRERE